MLPSPSQNTEAVCNQITILILCYTSSSLVTILNVTDTTIQVSDISDFAVSVKLINLTLRYFLFLFL